MPEFIPPVVLDDKPHGCCVGGYGHPEHPCPACGDRQASRIDVSDTGVEPFCRFALVTGGNKLDRQLILFSHLHDFGLAGLPGSPARITAPPCRYSDEVAPIDM